MRRTEVHTKTTGKGIGECGALRLSKSLWHRAVPSDLLDRSLGWMKASGGRGVGESKAVGLVEMLGSLVEGGSLKRRCGGGGGVAFRGVYFFLPPCDLHVLRVVQISSPPTHTLKAGQIVAFRTLLAQQSLALRSMSNHHYGHTIPLSYHTITIPYLHSISHYYVAYHDMASYGMVRYGVVMVWYDNGHISTRKSHNAFEHVGAVFSRSATGITLPVDCRCSEAAAFGFEASCPEKAQRPSSRSPLRIPLSPKWILKMAPLVPMEMIRECRFWKEENEL